MDELVPLQVPEQRQLAIDPNALFPAADGFNYPTLRLLNKQARISISQSLALNHGVQYQALSVANTCGWFAAIRTSDIILSPLEDLRTRISAAKAEDKSLFVPKRTLTIVLGKPCIIAFGARDSMLFVGLEEGHVLTYDTATLFSESAQGVSPAHVFQNPDTGPVRQISPNPGTEQNLADLCAIISSDNKVRLFNSQLESKGGWVGVQSGFGPVAVSWSPKGKHLAIGLRSGDILTYALSNLTAPHKHLPPTSKSPLVSLCWLGPGHTFKVTYNPPEDGNEPAHHIINLDSRSSLATYHAVRSPYCLPGRPSSAYSVFLPRWDLRPTSSEESKVLLVIGDSSSTDLEVLGGHNNQWYQQSLENPISLPLDENMEDTTLLALEADLTDAQAAAPVIYAYLNDGTIQAWYAEHTIPYIGITPPTIVSRAPSQSDSIQMDEVKPEAFNHSMSSDNENQTIFGHQPQTMATDFGSTPFGAQNSTNTSNAFGSSSNQTPFGLASPSTPSIDSMSMTREASMSDSTPSFGGLSLGISSTDEKPKPSTGIFGSFTAPTASLSTPAFGSGIALPTGFGAFSNFGAASTDGTPARLQSQPVSEAKATGQSASFSKPVFGQSTFGQSSFGKPSLPSSSTSAFGQPSFGQPSIASNPTSTFGQPSFGTASLPSSTSTGGGGFGAFASAAPASFGGSSGSGGFGFGSQNNKPPDVTTGGSNASPFSAAGQSPFANPDSTRSPFAATQSAFPSAGGAKTSAFAPDASTSMDTASPVKLTEHTPSTSSSEVATTGGSFAPGADSAPATSGAFSNLKATPSAFRPAAGFGAFANNLTAASPFFKAAVEKVTEVKAFSTDTPALKSAFGAPVQSGPTKPVFGVSGFGSPSTAASTPPASASTGTTPGAGAFSAFSGTGGGFSAFSGGTKSFGEFSKGESAFSAALPTQVKADVARSSSPPFSAPAKQQEKPLASEHISSTTTDTPAQPEDVTSEDDDDAEEGEEEEEEESGGEEVLSEEGFGSGSEEETDEGDLEELSVPSRSASPGPEEVPLPPSRSPSTTPKPPKISISSSQEDEPTVPPGLPTIKEESGTTPPGSPVKPSAPPAVIDPANNGPGVAPFGTLFGRLSTKPTRSSPLAANSVSNPGDNSHKEQQPPFPKPVIASPLFGLNLFGKPSETQTPSSQPLPPRTPPLSSKVPSISQSPMFPAVPPGQSMTSASQVTQTSLTGPLNTPSFSFGSRISSPPTATPPPVSAYPSPPSGSSFQAPPKRDASGSSIPKVGPTPPVFSLPSKPKTPPFGAMPMTPTKSPFNEASLSPSPVQLPGGVPPPGMTSGQRPAEQVNLEEGMQKECAILVQMMARELEQLRLQAQHIVQKMNSQKPLGPSKKQADLSDPARWGHGDAVYFGTLLRSYEEDLIKLKAQHEHSRSCLKELRSGMLKAGTRKEEISRFKKANSDQEFSKMLKSRTLGPEHLETQIQLRRKIRAMRDRIQQLEDHLNSSKKRINEVNSARPSMKAPSFDTVNRTYRNIDIAIQQQSTDVSKLSARLSKLDLTSRPNRSERDPRLPDRVIKQPYHVTPHVATTTAAALNAERSAHKLKRALLKVRMEPLMNTTAATAPPPPVTFNTPKKPDSSSQVEGLDSPEWSLPEDQFNPSTPVPTRRGAGTGTKRHQSVPLRRGPASTPSPNPSSFDWGPLPQFSAQPAATMIRNVQLVPIGPTTPPPSRLPTGFVPLTKKS